MPRAAKRPRNGACARGERSTPAAARRGTYLGGLLAPGVVFDHPSGSSVPHTAAISLSRLSTISRLTAPSPASPKSLLLHSHSRSAPSMSVKVSPTALLYHGRSLVTFPTPSRLSAYHSSTRLRLNHAIGCALSTLLGVHTCGSCS